MTGIKIVLADTVRTLNSLSEMKDDASQQRALLYAALIEQQFELGAPDALTAAQAQEDSDQSAFEASATLGEQHLYDNTVTGPPMDLAEVLEQLMVDSNTPDVASVSASQWYASMTGTIDRMRIVEERLAASAVAQSQVLEQGAERSALLTVFLSLALLLLALVATLIVARSMVRPLRVLRSDALEIASVRLPEKVRELSDAEDMTAGLGVAPVSVHSSDEIGEVGYSSTSPTAASASPPIGWRSSTGGWTTRRSPTCRYPGTWACSPWRTWRRGTACGCGCARRSRAG